MSIKKLETMLKKLDQTDKMARTSAKGGFVGLGHEARTSLSKAGGSIEQNFAGTQGGRKCGGVRSGGVLLGGSVEQNFAGTQGGVLSGGIRSGGACPTCGQPVVCKCKNKKKCLCGGGLSGGVLLGGSVEQNFAGTQGGKRGRPRKLLQSDMVGGVLSGGVLLGGSVEQNFAGTQGGRMRSDYRSYNSATEQRGSARGKPSAPLPYGYNAIDTNVAGGVGCGGRYKKGVPVKAPQLNAWRSHLTAYRNAHPNMSLKEAMKGASATYK